MDFDYANFAATFGVYEEGMQQQPYDASGNFEPQLAATGGCDPEMDGEGAQFAQETSIQNETGTVPSFIYRPTVEKIRATVVVEASPVDFALIGGISHLPDLIRGACFQASSWVDVNLSAVESILPDQHGDTKEWVFIEEDPSSPTFDESGIANIAGVQEGPAAVAITKPKISRDGSREITRAVLRFFHELPPQQRISIVIRDVESGIRDWLSEEVRNHYYQTLTDHNQTSRKLHGFLTDRVKDLKKWGFLNADHSLTEEGKEEHRQPTKFAPLANQLAP